MPRAWYVLLRFWLRVDNVVVRLYETRVLCDFNAGHRSAAEMVRAEVRHCEGSYEEMRLAGAPADRVRPVLFPFFLRMPLALHSLHCIYHAKKCWG